MRDKKAYYREWYAKNRERLIAKAGLGTGAPGRNGRKKRKWQACEEPRGAEGKPAALRQKSEKGAACYSRYRQTDALQGAGQSANATTTRTAARLLRSPRDGFQHLGIKGSELPQTLVDAQRELMKLKRELMNGT